MSSTTAEGDMIKTGSATLIGKIKIGKKRRKEDWNMSDESLWARESVGAPVTFLGAGASGTLESPRA